MSDDDEVDASEAKLADARAEAKNLFALDVTQRYKTEPMEKWLNFMIENDIHLSIKQCMHNFDLTQFIIADMYYRYYNSGDIAINIVGRPNKGKSNIGLWLASQWADITEYPLVLDNVVFTKVDFNFLLKGQRIVTKGKELEIKEFKLKRGMGFVLDEGSDTAATGDLSMTLISQTADIENRMRALQVGRFCSGVSEILHTSYYDIWAIERDPIERTCFGIVYAKEKGGYASNLRNLGFVKVPYVPKEIFDPYYAYKVASITDYSRGGDQNRLSKITKFFSKKLFNDREYQKLPLTPKSPRMTWIRSNPDYTTFSTKSFINQLEEMSRNQELHAEVAPTCRCSKRIHEVKKDVSDKRRDSES